MNYAEIYFDNKKCSEVIQKEVLMISETLIPYPNSLLNRRQGTTQ